MPQGGSGHAGILPSSARIPCATYIAHYMLRNMTGYRALARNRDFTILWIGETVNELGSTMSLFVFPLLGYHLTGSSLVAAMLESLGLLGMCATLLPAGVLADRVDRQKVMLVASAGGALLYGSLVVAGALGVLTVPHLAVVALLTGVGSGLFQPAQRRGDPRGRHRPRSCRRRSARTRPASTSPRSLGGPLGGAAVRRHARGRRSPVDAMSYASPASPLSRIRTDLRPPAARRRADASAAAVKEGFRFIWRPAVLPDADGLVGADQPGRQRAASSSSCCGWSASGCAAAQIGLVSTAAGIGGILGALAAPYVIDRMRTGSLTVLVGWMCVLPLLPLMWWSTTWAACVSVFTPAAAQPGWQRRDRRLPGGDDARTSCRAGSGRRCRSLDGRDAAGAAARRLLLGEPRWIDRDRRTRSPRPVSRR